MKIGPGFKRRFGREVRKGKSRYKESGASIYKKIIKDGYDGKEFIVEGDGNTTFGEACKKNWQFESVSKNSSWFIKDERGNDVTDSFLETFDGIFILIPEYGSEMKEREPDKSDTEYSIHDSVTYYD
ncbi:MAG: hypothetical protein RTV72_00890 [Candidatus Thorarchaeota archaeon]